MDVPFNKNTTRNTTKTIYSYQLCDDTPRNINTFKNILRKICHFVVNIFID